MRGATLRQLRTFAAVARQGTFVRAAEELHLTPPAVSMQIKELEDEIGLPLFDRGARAVTLTLTGEYLLVYVRRVLTTLKEADDSMARLRGAQVGRINIGMVSTATYFLPRVLARFRNEHRGVEMRLALGNREQLVQQLQDADVDLAVMGRPPRELAARAEPFAAHPHAVIAAPVHTLAGRRAIAASDLSSEEFIVREEGSGTRAAMEQFFRDRQIDPPRIMEMSSNETIKQAVIANMGLAFLSLHTAALEIETRQICVLDVLGLPLVRSWHIVHLQSKPLAPAAEALRYFILEQGAVLLAQQFAALAPLLARL
ncbi:MAG TPA: LysR substrate-binding domain-containing protein [Burkholderiaceae bacterium]|nr:LysR substrate-binding domain-containing protein [Burkholderiaceae bacterium]